MKTKYPVDADYLEIFRVTLCQDVDYRAMIRRIERVGPKETSSQIIIRLFEAGLLSAFGEKGNPVLVQDRLRFDGVGVEYEV